MNYYLMHQLAKRIFLFSALFFVLSVVSSAQDVLVPRPGWVCPNGNSFETCNHDCRWIHKYADGRISRSFEQKCSAEYPNLVPPQDFRPNFRFGDQATQADDGFHFNAFVDYWDLEDWENPQMTTYWEVGTPPQLVLRSSKPMDKHAGETSFYFTKDSLETAPAGTRKIRIVLDSGNAVGERDEGDNSKSYSMPVTFFDLGRVEMRNATTLRIQFFSDFGDPDATRRVRVQARINGIPIDTYFDKRNVNFPNRGDDAVELNLPAFGIARFEDNIVFDLTVSVDQIVRTRRVAIPLPTIFVGGIDPVSVLPIIGSEHAQGGNGAFAAFEDFFNSRFESIYGTQSRYPCETRALPGLALKSYCYLVNVAGYPAGFPEASDSGGVGVPYYPTMHTLSFFGESVDRNTVGLFAGGTYLKTAIDTILSRTYANRVNLIAHSKGCLLTRAMFAQNLGYGLKVRNAVLIQGPHLGSIAAEDPFAAQTILPVITQYPADVYRSLWPLWTYFKSASDPIRGGKWHSQPEFENIELVRLNRKALPSHSGVKYTILYSNKHRTAYTQRGGNFLNAIFSWGGGDMVVPEFSQRGYTYNANNRKAYNPLNPNQLIGLIPAFVKPVQTRSVSWQKINSTHIESMSMPETFEKVWAALWSAPITN